MGPAFERFTEGFGKPSPDRVICRARADKLNPIWWTPERVEKPRLADDGAYQTDVLENFADPSEAFITHAEITRATRKEPLELATRPGRKYVCALDPGTRGNSWTMVLVAGFLDAEGVNRYEVVLCRQWTGSSLSPLSPLRGWPNLAPRGRPQKAADNGALRVTSPRRSHPTVPCG